jgi:Raf kinase inhibitor-like YbhB/YbcL family protein
MKIISDAFENGKLIPSKYTCDGSDISPSISWDSVPDSTKSFVLIVDDPDAPHGTWDHWILFNIPNTVRKLPENISALPEGTREGKNSWDKIGYGGPCPPSGVHRYFFKLYALDSFLILNNGANKTEIMDAMKNHIIGEASLLGKYERTKK